MRFLCSWACIFVLFVQFNCLFAQDHYWLQVMPNNELWFRFVTEKSSCPDVTVDGKVYTTLVHHDKTIDFPVTSCKLILPDDAENIVFGSHVIPSVHKEIKRIFIVGDTGCRVKGSYVQDCKRHWPFKRIVDTGAEYAPDLVIHLGDYLYREFCRSEGCKNEVLGNNKAGWDEDFFKPAKSLLNIAPWLMVRGNHEDCSRGGKGWVHFFDYRQQCSDYTDAYSVEIVPNLYLIVADSSYGHLSQSQLSDINKLSEKSANSWLLTHKPLWSKEGVAFVDEELKPELLSKNISAVFSGHIHLFQISERLKITQVILGNGGADLKKLSKPTEFTREEFGFAILDKQGNKGWQLSVFNVNNEVIFSHYISNVAQVN